MHAEAVPTTHHEHFAVVGSQGAKRLGQHAARLCGRVASRRRLPRLDQPEMESAAPDLGPLLVGEHKASHPKQPETHTVAWRELITSPPSDGERLRRHVVGIRSSSDPTPREPPQIIEVIGEQHAETCLVLGSHHSHMSGHAEIFPGW